MSAQFFVCRQKATMVLTYLRVKLYVFVLLLANDNRVLQVKMEKNNHFFLGGLKESTLYV